MGKNPSVAILAMGLAFCAFCHFFVTCNADDASDLRKGIESLSKVMVKYRAELDNKVKFVKLQEAIDAIDEAMLGYQGKAKDKLPRVRNLNSDARLTYENCVAPVFEWCISINSTIDVFIPHINDINLSKSDKDMIWNITVNALNKGLAKTTKSLELLTNVQYKTAELKNLFQSILHDVHDDFGYNGYYGQAKADLEAKIADNEVARKTGIAAFVGILFGVIGALIFGPIGAAAGFAAAFAATYGIQELVHWNQKKTYKEQVEAIDNFFTLLTKKIEEATEIVKGIEVALEEDKTNLHKLRGVIEGANINKDLLLSEAAFLRAMYIPDIQKLKDECTNYVNWHGYDAPFYQRMKTRTRRAASSFCRVQRSEAKDMLVESASSNSTRFQTMNRIIDQIDC
ncbi:uncharacterized protein Dana_GF20376, isoform A [Drosophila ananassae]|uniref:Uncharacterized protein, isoform A n=2 Tax=Drosophila ananassae TaxID=7217 RepID=B3MQ50_DROAN|nr:uncharacterized protein LOC6503084 isoform X1 [Drosophila ananassae]EDV44476.1 uncharacterized protein Dana_GF20376, isoform A [Drosophila ananassae]